jgi:hypothetical protein
MPARVLLILDDCWLLTFAPVDGVVAVIVRVKVSYTLAVAVCRVVCVAICFAVLGVISLVTGIVGALTGLSVVCAFRVSIVRAAGGTGCAHFRAFKTADTLLPAPWARNAPPPSPPVAPLNPPPAP